MWKCGIVTNIMLGSVQIVRCYICYACQTSKGTGAQIMGTCPLSLFVVVLASVRLRIYIYMYTCVYAYVSMICFMYAFKKNPHYHHHRPRFER